jgi:hypothetical protein
MAGEAMGTPRVFNDEGGRAGVGRVLDEETKRDFGSNFKDREVVGIKCGCDVWKQTETGLWRRDGQGDGKGTEREEQQEDRHRSGWGLS